MRPRQACLGIRYRQIFPDTTSVRSFNEAEASLPRNPVRTEKNFSTETGFNEAEASLPRNPGDPLQIKIPWRIRFNEAEASLPRNPQLLQEIGPDVSRLQ